MSIPYDDCSCSVGVVQLSDRDFYEAVDSKLGADNAESVDSNENGSMTPPDGRFYIFSISMY